MFVGMTATANSSTEKQVVSTLGMKNYIPIKVSPDKPSIYYGVLCKINMPKLAEMLADGLVAQGIAYPKTLVFCWRCYMGIHIICLHACN